MIRFSNVSKVYESGHYALKNINLEIDSGEMVFLTGHSGAGKTTLLKLIALIERPTRGQIFLNGKNITNLSKHDVPDLRRSIGMIFQNPQLLHNRTVYENVALPLVIDGYKPYEIQRRVHASLDKVGLLSKEKLLPPMLSSGEQQRVGIARAVVTRPALVIADEPTGNLDPQLSADIMNLFQAFNDVGVSLLIATHDIQLIQQLPHRILALSDGQLLGQKEEAL